MSQKSKFNFTAFLRHTSELGAEDAAEMLQSFLDDTADKTDVAASGGQSRSRIRHEANSIRRSAATLGFAELSCLAREIEERAEAMSPELLDEAIGVLRRVVSETTNFVRTELLLANLGSP